jgi:hypothetical protein
MAVDIIIDFAVGRAQTRIKVPAHDRPPDADLGLSRLERAVSF